MNVQKKIIAALVVLLSISSTFAYTLKEIESAKYLADLWVIQSHDNIDDFRLDSPITRKETLKTIGKLSAEEIIDRCDWVFADVNITDWGCKYIEFALRKNLIANNDNFRPEDLITKTEAMKLILKVRGIEKTQVTDNWQEDYMMTAFEKGIIEEKYTDYDEPATRWWIFKIATVVVKQYREDQMKKWEVDIYSDEAL